ncbi:hypothetical protein [Priestia megaterium]|uniref:hypothetical protein n=1 Tax=Priestia megaterium TaxID=1404 RepID=UPI000BFC30D0|nr:hypothetical protein [Priestia megaterium]PGQ88190.1 hypothetical protein COA18_04500 [Priestia megaterium]
MTIIYYSTAPKQDEYDALRVTRPQTLLLSFALWKNKSLKTLIEKIGYRPKSIILDPGAITFKNGKISTGIYDVYDHYLGDDYSDEEAAKEILEWALNEFYMANDSNVFYEYISYIHRNRRYIDHVLAFDEIGKADVSRYMYRLMRAMNLNPIPVFHYQNDFKYLKEYVDEGNELIALGGILMEPKIINRIEWVNECIARYPNQKFHVLGTQRKKIIHLSNNFYSCDGNSWKITAGYKRNRLPGQTKVEKAIEIIQDLEKEFSYE